METLIGVAGWIGSFFLIVAYILVSFKKLDGNSKSYQIMNLLGAVGVGLSVYHKEAWSALTVNVFWGLVAIVALINLRNLA